LIKRGNMTGKLVEYFNKQPRLGVISTSNRDGLVDCAVYGSPQMMAVLATFEVTQVRPLIDFGQGWEKSI
jgi:hypothetical protein